MPAQQPTKGRDDRKIVNNPTANRKFKAPSIIKPAAAPLATPSAPPAPADDPGTIVVSTKSRPDSNNGICANQRPSDRLQKSLKKPVGKGTAKDTPLGEISGNVRRQASAALPSSPAPEPKGRPKRPLPDNTEQVRAQDVGSVVEPPAKRTGLRPLWRPNPDVPLVPKRPLPSSDFGDELDEDIVGEDAGGNEHFASFGLSAYAPAEQRGQRRRRSPSPARKVLKRKAREDAVARSPRAMGRLTQSPPGTSARLLPGEDGSDFTPIEPAHTPCEEGRLTDDDGLEDEELLLELLLVPVEFEDDDDPASVYLHP